MVPFCVYQKMKKNVSEGKEFGKCVEKLLI